VTQDILKEELSYNQHTGEFTRLKSRGNQRAGLMNIKPKENGYVEIRVFDEKSGVSKKYKAHRLAWLYIHGALPNYIDHINHIRHDNRLTNLREVEKKDNSVNCSLSKANSTGSTGVYWHKQHKKWYTSIMKDGKTLFLGLYENKDEAINVRLQAQKVLGFHENHGKGTL